MSLTRREMVFTAAGTALVAGAAAVPFATGAAGGDEASPRRDTAAGAHEHDAYTETYQGRTIRVAPASAGGGVSIDGRPLHLMKFADDAYLSSMCHYEMAKSPLHAARRAVEELRGAALLPATGGSHGSHVTHV